MAGARILTRNHYFTVGREQFGVPGLIAYEVIGPFVEVGSLGPLIMIHDGRWEPRHGIGHHPHRFNERLFYILDGEVSHDDALNDIQGHMKAGDMGRLTEGVGGMLHKEWNDADGPARAFILVYETDPVPERASYELLADADAARYDEGTGVQTKELVGPKVSFPVNGDVRLFTDSTLESGAELSVEVGADECAVLYSVSGEVELDGDVEGSLSEEDSALLRPRHAARRIGVKAPGDARLIRVICGPGRT